MDNVHPQMTPGLHCYLLVSNIRSLYIHTYIKRKSYTKQLFHPIIGLYQRCPQDIYLVPQNFPSIDKHGLDSTYIPVQPLQDVSHHRHITACICNNKYHHMLLPYLSKCQGQTQYTCNQFN